MDLNVTITLSDQLFALIEDRVPRLNGRVRNAIKREVGSQIEAQSTITITATPTGEKTDYSEYNPEPFPELPQVPEAKPSYEPEVKDWKYQKQAEANIAAVKIKAEKEAKAAEEAKAKAEAEAKAKEAVQEAEESLIGATQEEARAALHHTRVRLLGEEAAADKSVSPEKYKAITALAKQLIMQLSEGKAAKLPDLTPEQRMKFIAECDTITLDATGMPALAKAPF